LHLRYRQTCRVCGNPHLTGVIDLGDQYLQGSFVHPDKPTPSRRKIPTRLVRCDPMDSENACGLVQMSVTVSPAILYANYWYASGVSQTMRDHLASIVREVKALVFPKPFETWFKPRVLDIACNDGTLLSCYGDRHMVECYGVDPSDIARTATQKAPGATIINDLFPTSALIDKGKTFTTPTLSHRAPEPIQFDAITTIAMFYDIEDPVAFIGAVDSHLKPHGIWVVEVAYLPATLKQVSLDTAVHEHLMYYSLATLENVIRAGGLRVFRAETNDINGGSIQVWCCKADCTTHDRSEWTAALNALRMAEFDLRLDTPEPYLEFQHACEKARRELRELIRDIRARGQTVFLYGASTKSMTLIQYCGFTSADIPYAVERSPAKWGARTLGTDIPIISEEEGRAKAPDYMLVGPWHFRDEILKRERDTINGGVRFIFALPTLEVVDHVPETAEVAA
jgi:SAM-dependent methyltransferase